MPRRQPRPSRETKKTVLIVTNGARTELSYLAELKRRAAQPGVRFKIEFVNGDPLHVLRKLRSPHGDSSAFDEVWIVVDEDGQDRSAFVGACRRACRKGQSWFAIVSRPCFEVWLIAHYEQVRRYAVQQDAQRHFRRLIPADTPAKLLPADFPYDEVGTAVGRCQLVGEVLGPLHSMPPVPGTAMPHLVRALGGWVQAD